MHISISKSMHVLVAVAVLQFFTWFKPSEPFFTPFVLEQFNITERNLISDIYAWDVVFQMLAGILLGSLYLAFGHRVALLACSASSVASVSCVLFSSSRWALLLSQAFWALSFSALYVLLIALLQLLPRKLFQKAVSINSVAMLAASTTSSFTGFMLLQFSPAVKDQSGRELTFFVTFGSTIISFALLCVCISPCINIFNRNNSIQREGIAGARKSCKCKSHVLLIKKLLINLDIVGWLLLSSIVRGTHTEVVTLWQILSEEIDFTKSKYNGIISMAAYILAAILVLLLIKLERLIVQHLWWFCPSILVLTATCLIAVSQSPSIVYLAVFYVFFHALAEMFLALATAQMAKHAYTDETSHLDYGQAFVILLSAKYTLSLGVEIIIQLLVWPQWGMYHNVFKRTLGIREQLLGLGGCIVLAFLLAVLMGVRIFRQQRARGRVHRRLKQESMAEKLLGNTNV